MKNKARIKVTVRSLELANEIIEYWKDKDVVLNVNVDTRRYKNE